VARYPSTCTHGSVCVTVGVGGVISLSAASKWVGAILEYWREIVFVIERLSYPKNMNTRVNALGY